MKQVLIMAVLLAIAGALLLGEGVAKTVGNSILASNIEITQVVVMTVLLSTAIWLIVASAFGLPISTTHATIGSIIGIGLLSELVWGIPLVRWDTISIIVIGWILSPIFSLAIAYFLQHYVRRKFLSKRRGLTEVRQSEQNFGWLLLVMVIIICLSRGGNDVAKAIGLLTVFFTGSIEFTLLLLLGGVGMGMGLLVLGRRVVKTVGIELTELRPSASFSSATAGAVVLLVGTIMSIPLAATHILITSLIGSGMANQIPSNRIVLRVYMPKISPAREK